MIESTEESDIEELSKSEVLEQVSGPIQEYFRALEADATDFDPDADSIPLNVPSFGAPEVLEALESMLSTWVTMGDKVEEFERLFADYVGVQDGVMVNSGSSANLASLKALRATDLSPGLDRGDEIIVPACTWSTSVAPILDVGCRPVLTDSDPSTFNVDPERVKERITDDTAAIMAVHLLGNPADMGALQEISEDHDLALVEDCCEAHGAEYRGSKVGSFGHYGTYSFFFAHHISTIEGGLVVSPEEARTEEVKPIRAHGWIREMNRREEIAEDHPEFDDRFLFVSQGLNIRPTEIQGAFGIHQMDRIEEFVSRRRGNATSLRKRLEPYEDLFRFQEEQEGGKHSYYGFPLVVRDDSPFDRGDVTEHLEDAGIETRPIMGGNLARHPAFRQAAADPGALSVADGIHERGIMIGNHHRMNQDHVDHVAETIEQFVSEVSS
jgi:CDP-6-deoxy-D-xylo-4-hexulose-3-dehydrase